MFDIVSRNDFIEWFRKSEERKNQFTYEGLDALFDHLEEYEEGTGEKIKFDPIDRRLRFLSKNLKSNPISFL